MEQFLTLPFIRKCKPDKICLKCRSLEYVRRLSSMSNVHQSGVRRSCLAPACQLSVSICVRQLLSAEASAAVTASSSPRQQQQQQMPIHSTLMSLSVALSVLMATGASRATNLPTTPTSSSCACTTRRTHEQRTILSDFNRVATQPSCAALLPLCRQRASFAGRKPVTLHAKQPVCLRRAPAELLYITLAVHGCSPSSDQIQ